MAKEYYDVTYKTYFNDRIKPVVFQGKETYPLYVQVTYDRKTTFFKSYYFDVFAQPKYDFLKTTISQMVEMESGALDFIIARNTDRFSLDHLSRQYKIVSRDLLDSFDGPFKIWLATYFREEGLPGLAAMMEHVLEEVPAIQLWDDFKKVLDPVVFDRMEEKAAQYGPPYIPLAAYIRNKLPKGPFCLPVHEWVNEDKRIEIEEFIDDTFWLVDMDQIVRTTKLLLYPDGFF